MTAFDFIIAIVIIGMFFLWQSYYKFSKRYDRMRNHNKPDKTDHYDGNKKVEYRFYEESRFIEWERWYENDQLHRLNGPAHIEYHYENRNAQKEIWCKNNQKHRLDGPAIIWYDEDGNVHSKRWYINGNEIKNPPYKNYPLTEEQQIEMKLTYG